MKINSTGINKFVFCFIVIYIVFSGIIGAMPIWHLIILGIYIMTAFFNRKNDLQKEKKHTNNLISVLMVVGVILFLSSLVVSSNYSAAMANIRSSLYPLCGIGILYILNRTNDKIICTAIFKHISFFNVILIINIVVLILQVRGTGFLIRSSWLAENPFYEDHCAGLFGFNATNILGIYSVFVMMANLSYMMINRKRKNAIIAFVVITQGIMAFLSQYNDNTGFYFMTIVFLAVYAYTAIERDSNLVRRIMAIVKYILLIMVIFVIVLYLPVLGDYIRKIVFDKIQRFFFYESFGGASGGNERLAIVRYAFQLKSTWAFGTGVGATQWFERAYGFAHFGINSMGSYILLGGLWFYLIYTSIYTAVYYSMFAINKTEKSFMMKLIVFAVVIFFSMYTTIFNDARTAIIVGLIAVVIRPLLERRQ